MRSTANDALLGRINNSYIILYTEVRITYLYYKSHAFSSHETKMRSHWLADSNTRSHWLSERTVASHDAHFSRKREARPFSASSELNACSQSIAPRTYLPIDQVHAMEVVRQYTILTKPDN